MRKLAFLTITFAALFAAAPAARTAPPKPGPSPTPAPTPITNGTISVCNTSGARPITGSLSYTLAAVAAAGGTQTITVPVGTCATQIFYPQGTSVTVTENVPTGDAVTSITLSGGAATLSSSAPTAGSAVVVVGNAQALLTFVTSGPPLAPPAARNCKVPNLLGLGLTSAKAGLLKAACTLGRIRRAYSSGFRAGHVMAEAPRRGLVLAPHAPVDLVLSRGPKP
jgi:hypothetical protein